MNMSIPEIMNKIVNGIKLTNDYIVNSDDFEYVYFEPALTIPYCFRIRRKDGTSDVLNKGWIAPNWRLYKKEEKEYKVGEIFEYNEVKLGVLQSSFCKYCYFQHTDCPTKLLCRSLDRKDHKHVIFVEIGKYEDITGDLL